MLVAAVRRQGRRGEAAVATHVDLGRGELPYHPWYVFCCRTVELLASRQRRHWRHRWRGWHNAARQGGLDWVLPLARHVHAFPWECPGSSPCRESLLTLRLLAACPCRSLMPACAPLSCWNAFEQASGIQSSAAAALAAAAADRAAAAAGGAVSPAAGAARGRG